MKTTLAHRAPPRRLSAGLSTLMLALLVGCSSGGSDADQIAAAKGMLEKKDAKAAVVQLKSALQKNPKSAEGRFLLGKTLLASGDPVAALVELQKAQELQFSDDQVIPEIARAMLAVGDGAKLITQYGSTPLKSEAADADLKTSLANAYAVKGDLPKAAETVEVALKTKPGYGPAMLLQARIAAAEGRLDDAMALLDKTIAANTGASDQAMLLKAEFMLYGKRDLDGALATLRKALEANPSLVPAHAAVGNISMMRGRFDEAKAEFEALKKLSPTHPETLLLEGQLALVDNNAVRAREVAEMLLKVMPENVRALELAGAAELQAKNYAKAETHLGTALKVAPQAPRPTMLLAQTYLKSGQPDKALETLKPALESPNPGVAVLSLAGEAYLQTGDSKRSQDAFDRAMKAAPDDKNVRTTAAIAQLARGDNAGAALAQLESLAGSEKDTRADMALISARLSKQDLAGALKAIEALEKKVPTQAMPSLLRGRVMLLKKDIPAATAAFEAAIAKDPSYFPAVASLAAIELSTQKTDAARKRFEDFIKANPKSYQAKLAMAEFEARAGAPDDKVNNLLREATKISPTEPMPHLQLIRRLIQTGDPKSALVAAQDASALLPNNLELQEALGEAQIAAGDGQRAITTFKKLASAQPKNAAYAVRLSDAFRANKDTESAIGALKQALEAKPDLAPARGTLVALLLQEKRAADAMAVARAEQARDPKSPVGLMLEADIEASRKNWDGAIAAQRAALKLNPADPNMVTRLHAALNAAGKSADADKLAADWLREHPKDPVFKYYQGDLALARSEWDKAEAAYREVMAVQPTNALAINNVAWLLARQGKPGAVALAEQANKLMPDRAPLIDTLSSALEAENKLPQAIEAQTRAIRLQPGDPNLVLRLGKLYIKSGDKVRAKAELESLTKLGDKFAGQAEVASLLKTL